MNNKHGSYREYAENTIENLFQKNELCEHIEDASSVNLDDKVDHVKEVIERKREKLSKGDKRKVYEIINKLIKIDNKFRNTSPKMIGAEYGLL